MNLGAVLSLLLISTPVLAQSASSLSIDAKASVLKWTGHAEVGSYAPSGTLSLSEGQLRFEGNQFSGARLVVQMSSLRHENADLQHHLMSADFFDVEHFPEAVILIDRVAQGVAFGSLTIHGKTTPFQTPVKATETGNRFVVTGSVALDRTRYGIVYNSTNFFSGLGNKAIRNQFEVEFTVVGNGSLPEKFRS